jgi:hypothetical protein
LKKEIEMVNSPSGWNPAAGLRGGQRPPYPKPLPEPPNVNKELPRGPYANKPLPDPNSITDNLPRNPSPESPLPVNVPLGRPLPPTPPETEGATIAGDIEGILGGDVVPTRERLE